MEGFGQKSYDNLMNSIEKAKETTLARVIYSLGIANIGLANAKVICRHFDDDLDKIRHARWKRSVLLIPSGRSLPEV